MIVKVCGLQQTENIAAVSVLPAVSWLGFIFYEKSPRRVGQSTQLPALQPFQRKVGVFVHETHERILATAALFQLDMLQLHGHESPEDCAMLSAHYPVIKAFSVDDAFDFSLTAPYLPYCRYFLFDTKGVHYGGNGVKFNWQKLQAYTFQVPFLLSGGITPADVGVLQQFQHPQWAGIDLNSGFEIAPGLKDIDKLSKFLQDFKQD